MIEDDLLAEGIPPRINNVRLRHCISRTLELAGYNKWSKRGHGWNYGGLSIKDRHDTVIKKIIRRFKKTTSDFSVQATLTSFISI